MFGSNHLSIQNLSGKQSCDHMSPVSGCGLSSVGGVAKQRHHQLFLVVTPLHATPCKRISPFRVTWVGLAPSEGAL